MALGELQDGVGGPCLIQPCPDQEHPLSHRSMGTIVKVKLIKMGQNHKKNGLLKNQQLLWCHSVCAILDRRSLGRGDLSSLKNGVCFFNGKWKQGLPGSEQGHHSIEKWKGLRCPRGLMQEARGPNTWSYVPKKPWSSSLNNLQLFSSK